VPTENTDRRVILRAVREIQNDLSLQTAKPLSLFGLEISGTSLDVCVVQLRQLSSWKILTREAMNV
jgi:hypothetical protein